MAAMPSAGRVLILGADGFIGRHLCFALHRAGWQVIACARRPARLAAMGFDTLAADLTDPATHDPGFWAPHLTAGPAGPVCVVNAAGLLTGSEDAMQAVHQSAPVAIYRALPKGARAVLISAIGIDDTETGFARHRRAGELLATRHGVTILRPGLVLGDTSWGGSSLARALACLPLAVPVVGDGRQPFNPIHADDLARIVLACLTDPPPPGPHPVGGPETVTQATMLRAFRCWIGLKPAPLLRLPLPLARALGGLGDLMRWGPISRTSVDQLAAGVLAPPDPALAGHAARGFSDFVAARPAGTQDLWHARLYLMRPLLRLVLALLWLGSGLIGLLLPAAEFLPLVAGSAQPDWLWVALARLGGLADLAIAAALLRGWRPRLMAAVQAGTIAAYTMAFAWLAPALWLLPLGGLLKNLPLLALVAVLAVLEDER